MTVKTMIASMAVLAVVGFAAPAHSGIGPTCCLCDECDEVTAAQNGSAAQGPGSPPCFNNPSDSGACDEFCQAVNCESATVEGDSCGEFDCNLVQRVLAPLKPAPALGSLGLALAALGAGLGGMMRITRRRRG